MSRYTSQALFAEAAAWDLFDVNVRVGPAGVSRELSLDTAGLLAEMDRYFIRSAVAAHWTAEVYDPVFGIRALEAALDPRLVPAWVALPGREFVDELAKRKPKAVRLAPKAGEPTNFPLTAWGAGDLLEYLQAHSVVTLIAREAIAWETLAGLLTDFPGLVLVLLDTGYRVDNFLFPLLRRFPTLHFDSATYLAHRQLESFVNRHGPDRLLFGTRLPLFTPASSLGVLASARISDAARLAIAGGNLRRLLAQAQQGSHS